VDYGGQVSPADVSISDQLRSGVAAVEVPWGTGAQDAAAGSPPVLVDSNSLSDRLRGVAAAAENPSQRDQLVGGSGGGAFTGPTAVFDPESVTGTLDWSDVLTRVPSAINSLAGAAATVLNGYARLAGIHQAAPVAGNPAPGGTPQPSLLQRLLGGPTVGTGYNPQTVPGATLGNMGGLLLAGGVVVGVVYLATRRR
jgi:hypothetical protein